MGKHKPLEEAGGQGKTTAEFLKLLPFFKQTDFAHQDHNAP